MLQIVKVLSSKTFLKYVLIDSFLLVNLTWIIQHYKLFFMLCSSCIVAVVIYRMFKYLIDLCSSTETDNADLFQIKLKYFLFRNESFYKLIKNVLFNKNYLRKKFEESYFAQTARADSTSDIDSSSKYSKITKNLIKNELEIFFEKFSKNFIETWYLPYISRDEQFLNEVRFQLVLIINNILSTRFMKLRRIDFLSNFSHFLNRKFFNLYLNYVIKNQKSKSDLLDLNLLHPAVRNCPQSEIAYQKRFVQIMLRKSGANLNINSLFVEEFFMQIIGKNCAETIINLLSKPNFLYFTLAYLINKEKTLAAFAHTKKAPPDFEEEKFSLDEDYSNQNSFIFETDDTLPDLEENDNDNVSNELNRKMDDVFFEVLDQKSNANNNTNVNQLESFHHRFKITHIQIESTETCVETNSGKEYTNYSIILNYKLGKDESGELHEKLVKRRYKEFLELKTKLEQISSLHVYLKKIQAPRRYMNLPIGKMDQDTIEKRKRKLDIYLNVITEFFSYNIKKS